MIKISRKEYEGMKETIEILQNPDMMKQILESEKNIKEGKIEEFDLVKQFKESLEDVKAERIRMVA